MSGVHLQPPPSAGAAWAAGRVAGLGAAQACLAERAAWFDGENRRARAFSRWHFDWGLATQRSLTELQRLLAQAEADAAGRDGAAGAEAPAAEASVREQGRLCGLLEAEAIVIDDRRWAGECARSSDSPLYVEWVQEGGRTLANLRRLLPPMEPSALDAARAAAMERLRAAHRRTT